MTTSKRASRFSGNFPLKFVALGLFLWCSHAFAASAPTVSNSSGYGYFQAGDPQSATPGPVKAGMMLEGGGREVDAAFRWFVTHAGHGHVVILTASGTDALQRYFYRDVGGVASVQTLVFHSRKAASDPRVLNVVRHADGIFIRGGDQSNYVRFWKGTPLNRLLDEHVRGGKPIGGTSAGLAILGAYGYGAMDGGSMVSKDALRDPLGKGITLVGGFLHMPYLQNVITDTHFGVRKRLGRLLAFIANLQHQGHADVAGLGVDQGAVLCVDARGIGHVFTNDNGFAWLVQPQNAPAPMRVGKPLTALDTRITGIGTQSRIDMHDLSVTHPVFHVVADVRDGQMTLHGEATPLLVIQGGTGVERAEMTPEIESRARASLKEALRTGYAQLHAGKPALDGVTAAVTVMENEPLFKAGRGTVSTDESSNEADASIMDGSTLAAGGVAAVQHIRNPILLARAVMERSRHVLMFGRGAEQFAVEQGFKFVDPSPIHSGRRWQIPQQARKADSASKQDNPAAEAHFSTVGAVARDSWGRLAAATSSGGITEKLHGRVGDSPIPGAGTYANRACAVSGTGSDESYIRVSAAREICMRIADMGQSVKVAGAAVINDEIPRLGGDGGAIILGADGSVSMPFNTAGMYRGWIGSDGEPHVAIYAADALVLPTPGG